MTEKLTSFPPVLPEIPKVLILGSMPSVKSFEKQEYYGNPRNHFWPIMFELFGQELVTSYEEKVAFVKKHHIALWDTIGTCRRNGSLDSNIIDEEPNDIVGLLKKYPSIRLIACNGTKSFNTFKKFIRLDQHLHVEVIKLPSSSPIPGKHTKSFAGKVEAWKNMLAYL